MTIANAQPNLKDTVCQLSGDYLENGETWAASFFGPAIQPRVEESPKPQPDEDRFWVEMASATLRLNEVADMTVLVLVVGERKSEGIGVKSRNR